MNFVRHLYLNGWLLRRRFTIFLNGIGVDGQDFLTVGGSSMLLEETLNFLITPTLPEHGFKETRNLFADLGTSQNDVNDIISRSCNYLHSTISEITGIPFEKFVLYNPQLRWEYCGGFIEDVHIYSLDSGGNTPTPTQ